MVAEDLPIQVENPCQEKTALLSRPSVTLVVYEGTSQPCAEMPKQTKPKKMKCWNRQLQPHQCPSHSPPQLSSRIFGEARNKKEKHEAGKESTPEKEKSFRPRKAEPPRRKIRTKVVRCSNASTVKEGCASL